MSNIYIISLKLKCGKFKINKKKRFEIRQKNRIKYHNYCSGMYW